MRRALLLGALLLVAGACGDEETPVTTTPDPDQRYRIASVTVLESPEHGPQLCLGGVAESYPPQCGGIDVTNWAWDTATAESANGTTWVTVSLTGTYDGEAFTVDGVGEPEPFEGDDHDFSPICDDFDPDAGRASLDVDLSDIDGLAAVWVSDPNGDDWDGPFVVNVIATPGRGDDVRDAVAERWDGALCVEERDQPTEAELQRITEELQGDVPFEVVASSGDVLRGVVVADVVVADDAARAYAEDRWGDTVVLRPVLVPIT